MTWINLKFEIGLDADHPEGPEFSNVVTKIQRIIGNCLDITDEKLITTYDHVFADWKVIE